MIFSRDFITSSLIFNFNIFLEITSSGEIFICIYLQQFSPFLTKSPILSKQSLSHSRAGICFHCTTSNLLWQRLQTPWLEVLAIIPSSWAGIISTIWSTLLDDRGLQISTLSYNHLFEFLSALNTSSRCWFTSQQFFLTFAKDSTIWANSQINDYHLHVPYLEFLVLLGFPSGFQWHVPMADSCPKWLPIILRPTALPSG